MFVSCVHPVAVLNAAFCMTCNLSRLFFGVFAITERRDMGLNNVPLCLSFLGFGVGTMFANFPYVMYYVVVKSSFKHTREGM